ncbi:MAG: isoprenylcysteine carboxylmethyltransferase family protein [Pseudomonadales bacterium]|nr:isoprenylcysteine carboxylmethyltransferase family protein [Pseudomonadales bacterium]
MTLLIYFLLYLLLAFVWRTLLVYRKTGINPLTLSSADDAYGYVGRAFKVVIAASGLIVLLNAHPDLAGWLAPIPDLRVPGLEILGWCLLLASLVWVLIAQAQMGLSWRIGIDSENPTELVQKGLFSVSRNPIFLSMRVTLLGVCLVAPSAATLAVLIAGEILIQVQVRLEETHLADLHGEQYKTYQASVRRWL